MITREEIVHIAELARLEFSEDELNTIGDRLNSILDYVDNLNDFDTTDVEPTFHILPIQNVLREDAVIPSLDRDIALKNAPSHEDGCFKVPKVIE